MKLVTLKELYTQEALEQYYKADDKLSAKLDEYYSNSIMFMSINKPELYNLYIDLNKETVKARMLRQIVKKKESKLSCQQAVKRISDLKQELKTIRNNPKKKTRADYVKTTLNRLELWAKDINYEERKGKTRYKA